MKLVIISHTSHYRRGDTLVGWGATVREINHLAALFDRVVHIAPVHDDDPPESSLPYEANNVVVRPVRPAGGDRLCEKFGILPAWLQYSRVIVEEVRSADVVHIRCPANISLLAVILLAFSRKPAMRWVKYAGNWRPDSPEAFSSRFQRWWLRSNLCRTMVTVNGEWSGDRWHIRPFYNPCLTESECFHGKKIAQSKQLGDSIRLIFVGSLETGKGAGRAIEVVERLSRQGVDVILDLVGDGPERKRFERKVEELGMASKVFFRGWLSRLAIPPFLATAHFMILPTASEGWPKVLSEGMAYGVVPLSSKISSIPQIISKIGCGRALDPYDVDAFAEAIRQYAAAPHLWKEESEKGVLNAHLFTYENYLDSVRRMLQNE